MLKDITDVELYLLDGFQVLNLYLITHITLFIFIVGKDTDSLDVRVQEVL